MAQKEQEPKDLIKKFEESMKRSEENKKDLRKQSQGDKKS
jgi:hypothetical protein